MLASYTHALIHFLGLQSQALKAMPLAQSSTFDLQLGNPNPNWELNIHASHRGLCATSTFCRLSE